MVRRLPDSSDVAFVEMHDASVGGMDFSQRRVRVTFDKLSVFYAIAPLEYQVWLCRAELNLYGVTRIEFISPDGENRLVDDGNVADIDGQSIEWQALLTDHQVRRVSLQFASQGRLDVHCESAHLIVIGRDKHLEDWHGPL